MSKMRFKHKMRQADVDALQEYAEGMLSGIAQAMRKGESYNIDLMRAMLLALEVVEKWEGLDAHAHMGGSEPRQTRKAV